MTFPPQDKHQVQAALHLDELPDDDFMRLLAEANAAAHHPRPADADGRAITPDELTVAVKQATAGALLAQAKRAAGRSLAHIGGSLGVSRQRVKEILDSENLEIQTMVRVAAACGYEMSLSLRPLDASGPAFTAVLGPAEAGGHR